MADESFDIIVDVKQSSRRGSDKLRINAYAVSLPSGLERGSLWEVVELA
jgi:hypothetical protein